MPADAATGRVFTNASLARLNSSAGAPGQVAAQLSHNFVLLKTTLAEALANAAVDPVLRASDSKLKASSRSGGDFGATLAAALATERVDTPPGE